MIGKKCPKCGEFISDLIVGLMEEEFYCPKCEKVVCKSNKEANDFFKLDIDAKIGDG